MSVIIILTTAFYLISLSFGAIPIDKLNVITSSKTIHPEFETQLRNALKTEKNFFARYDATAVALIPLVECLPIVQLALSKETDLKEPLINVITSNSKRSLVEHDLDEIETHSTLIFSDIKDINKYSSESNEKSDVTKIKIVNLVTAIQTKLKFIIAKLSSGNSSLWEYPQLVAQPLLGLTLLISRFVPVRNTIFENESDESIISCQLKETLQSFFPKILRWRLKQLYTPFGYEDEITPYIEAVLDHPEFFTDVRDDKNIRCVRNRCDAYPYHCFMDKLQGEISFTEEKPKGHDHHCLIEYLLFLRSGVKETYDNAIDVMNGTCSNKMSTRNRDKTGRY